jgi:hypothetical protein
MIPTVLAELADALAPEEAAALLSALEEGARLEGERPALLPPPVEGVDDLGGVLETYARDPVAFAFDGVGAIRSPVFGAACLRR